MERVGGACEDCDIMYINQPQIISPVDTSLGWYESGDKLLLTGKIFEPDGTTPAKDILLYYWQANAMGVYPDGKQLDKSAKRHGYIRGWVKTNDKGEYSIYTIRPGAYPNDNTPAHIHILIKEPGFPNEYYIDDINFDDDPLLIPSLKKYPPEKRGGSGIVRLLRKDSLFVAEHNIVLGLNIPHYPHKEKEKISSGLNIGEDQPSFIPYHAYGADKGTRTCPVCKYGRYHGIIYYTGKDDWTSTIQWLKFLEGEGAKRSKYLKVYFVYGNNKNYNADERNRFLDSLGQALSLKHIALTYVPSWDDCETEVYLNKINPNVTNTIVIYKHRNIIQKMVDVNPSKKNFEYLTHFLDENQGYFDLEALEYH